jgi:ankyrin repeat protein
VNGWTALHWACKRNHCSVVQFLLQKGANKDIQTSKGEEPVDLTTSDDIIKLLGVTQNSSIVNQTTPSTGIEQQNNGFFYKPNGEPSNRSLCLYNLYRQQRLQEICLKILYLRRNQRRTMKSLERQ